MSRSLAPALVTAGDIMEFTLDGEPCEARGRTAVHRAPSARRNLSRATRRDGDRARPFAAVIPFGLVTTPMRATYHNAAFLAAGVPVFDIREQVRRDRHRHRQRRRKATALAEALADKAVLLLRAHGFVAVGAEPRRPRCSARSSPKSARACSCRRRARRSDRGARRGGRPQGRRAQPGDRRPLVGALEEAGDVITQQLVDAIRMLERAGYIDHNGHCSARRDATSFYINSGASVRGTLTVERHRHRESRRANLVEGTARPPLEFHIHSEVYRARPDVNAVMHTHPQWSTFLTMTGVPYQPVYAQGVLLGDIPLMDSPLSINTKPMGEKLAAMLGRGPAVLLKAHGVVVVGADIVECFALAAYVEENAYRQYMAMQIGDAVCVQRGGAAGVAREAVVAEPVQEDVGSLPVQAAGGVIRWMNGRRDRCRRCRRTRSSRQRSSRRLTGPGGNGNYWRRRSSARSCRTSTSSALPSACDMETFSAIVVCRIRSCSPPPPQRLLLRPAGTDGARWRVAVRVLRVARSS